MRGQLVALEALGSTPTPVAFAEVYNALQTGAVDSAVLTYTTIEVGRFAEIARSVAPSPLFDHVFVVFVSEAFLLRAPDWSTVRFVDVANLVAVEFDERSRDELSARFASLEEQGVVVDQRLADVAEIEGLDHAKVVATAADAMGIEGSVIREVLELLP